MWLKGWERCWIKITKSKARWLCTLRKYLWNVWETQLRESANSCWEGGKKHSALPATSTNRSIRSSKQGSSSSSKIISVSPAAKNPFWVWQEETFTSRPKRPGPRRSWNNRKRSSRIHSSLKWDRLKCALRSIQASEQRRGRGRGGERGRRKTIKNLAFSVDSREMLANICPISSFSLQFRALSIFYK